MLTEPQIQELRQSVEDAYRRGKTGHTEIATCLDGPLKGLWIHVEPNLWARTTSTVAWSMPTDRGLVVSNYSPADQPRTWRFNNFTYPGRRESGPPEIAPTVYADSNDPSNAESASLAIACRTAGCNVGHASIM